MDSPKATIKQKYINNLIEIKIRNFKKIHLLFSQIIIMTAVLNNLFHKDTQFSL